MKWRVDWLRYCLAVYRRMSAGAKEYGNASHKLSRRRFRKEVRDELADVSGWSALWLGRLPRGRK